jgi:hypothetical protein
LPRISIGLSTGRVNVRLFGAPQRQDYGPLVELVEVLFPDAAERDTLFWKTPQRLFGFAT